MTTAPFALLTPLPEHEGECTWSTIPGAAFRGWREGLLTLSDGRGGMRVVTALYDPDGRCGGASDLVAWDDGRLQETIIGRVETDGRVVGTHWRTEGDRHTPRVITDAEGESLKRLAAALAKRRH